MFGLPGIGGGGGLGGFFPIYIIFFMINFVVKLISGDLAELFPTDMPM